MKKVIILSTFIFLVVILLLIYLFYAPRQKNNDTQNDIQKAPLKIEKPTPKSTDTKEQKWSFSNVKPKKIIDKNNAIHEIHSMQTDFTKKIKNLNKEKSKEALLNFTKKLKSFQHFSSIYFPALAYANLQIGNCQESAMYYDKAISISPNESANYLGYAISLEMCGKTQKAISAYQNIDRNFNLKSSSQDFINNRIQILTSIPRR